MVLAAKKKKDHCFLMESEVSIHELSLFPTGRSERHPDCGMLASWRDHRYQAEKYHKVISIGWDRYQEVCGEHHFILAERGMLTNIS